MKKVQVVTFVLALCSMSFAASLPKRPVNSQPEKEAAARQLKQDALQSAVRSPLATTDCAFNFVGGTNNNSMAYCVTINGNIAELSAPGGHPLVSVEETDQRDTQSATLPTAIPRETAESPIVTSPSLATRETGILRPSARPLAAP